MIRNLVLAIALAALPCVAAADHHGAGKSSGAVQEVFICHFQEGKGMADLMKVVKEFNAAVEGMKAGKDYKAWLLTPIASQDLGSVVWVGQLPTMASMGALHDEYSTSEAGKRLDGMFQKTVACESRSFWQRHAIR